MPAPSVHLKIKIPVMVRRGISKRSHEKVGDCKQSTCVPCVPCVLLCPLCPLVSLVSPVSQCVPSVPCVRCVPSLPHVPPVPLYYPLLSPLPIVTPVTPYYLCSPC